MKALKARKKIKACKKQRHEGTQVRKAREYVKARSHVRHVGMRGTYGSNACEARNLAHSNYSVTNKIF